MDRNNLHCVEEVSGDTVALRKESVDRNTQRELIKPISFTVALRKESVDRNFFGIRNRKLILMSLSARRAWIEIPLFLSYSLWQLSLSARRAWIEIKIISSSVII